MLTLTYVIFSCFVTFLYGWLPSEAEIGEVSVSHPIKSEPRNPGSSPMVHCKIAPPTFEDKCSREILLLLCFRLFFLFHGCFGFCLVVSLLLPAAAAMDDTLQEPRASVVHSPFTSIGNIPIANHQHREYPKILMNFESNLIQFVKIVETVVPAIFQVQMDLTDNKMLLKYTN